MSHTHLLYHVVFATKNRLPLINEIWEGELHAYMGGIVKNFEGVPIEINGIEDYVHLLVRLKPKYSVSDFLKELKASSSKWVTRGHFEKFSWQVRYGAFTVSESQVGTVRKYIQGQKEHHRKVNFRDEYVAMLKAHGVEFDERYLWNR